MNTYLWILLAACVGVRAAYQCGDNIECDLGDDGVMTITGSGDMYEYNEHDEVRPEWFSERLNITKVVVGDGVLSVGNYSFADCENLETIEFADSVVDIKPHAFYNCSSLESLDLAKIEEIKGAAFAFCTNLTSIFLPETVRHLSHGAFRGCYNIANYTVADGNPSYMAQDGILYSLDGAVLLAYPPASEDTSFTIPDTVEHLGDYCFAYCDHLVEVVLKEGIAHLPHGCFQHCPKLEKVNIPDSVKSIRQSAFQRCISLESITIPDNCTAIGSHAFAGCKKLHDVVLSVNITKIMDHTFDGCKSLESITIPPLVEELESHAFYDCVELQTVWFMGTPDDPVVNKSSVFDKCDKLDVVCVTEGYKFDDFCGIPVSTTCNAPSSVSPSSKASSSAGSSAGSSPAVALVPSFTLFLFVAVILLSLML